MSTFDGFADIPITLRAIGWQLEDELREIERVVKKDGYAVHLGATSDDEKYTSLHNALVSPKWGYECSEYKDESGWKIRYKTDLIF